MSSFDRIADALSGEVLFLLFAPPSRTFWPFLAVGLLIALYFDYRQNTSGVAVPAHRRIFSRVVWLGQSALNDYGLVLINAVLLAFIGGYFATDLSAVTQPIGDALTAAGPLFADSSPLWVSVIVALIIFTTDDFLRYFCHYLEHRVPFLWELHKVHHSAEVLNFVTAERHHPVSLIIFRTLHGAGMAIANLAVIALFAGKVSAMTLFGANIFWFLSNLLGGTLRHSPVWLSFGPRIEKWFISPAQHQIHHSEAEKHFDRNFGSTFAIWDRMFGTLYVTTSRAEDITYGLGQETATFRSLLQLYLHPLRLALTPFIPNFAKRKLA